MTSLLVWTVTYLVHSTLLITAVWAASRWVRSASARDTLWKVALTGAVLTATLQTALPPGRVASTTAPRVTFDRAALARIAPVVVSGTLAPQPAAAPSSVDWRRGVLPFWGAVSLLLLLRVALGHRRFLAALGPRVEIVSGPDREMLDRLCARAGVSRPVRLTRARRLASPVAMLRFEIVIPADLFTRLGEEQRATILAHELGHLVRRDPQWLLVGEAMQAFFFFQPLNRLARARLRQTAEFLCDDAAVLHTGNGKALAETLAELAEHPVTGPRAVAAMAESGSHLVARVARVLGGTPAQPLRLRARLALAVLMTGLVAAFAPGMVADAVRASAKSVTGSGYYATTVNSFEDANLGQSFLGPEGTTRVTLDAHQFEVSLDGTRMRTLKRDGYLRAKQTSQGGPKREVEITENRSGELIYRYREDGVEKPWCDDARRVVIAGFRAEDAYADLPPRLHTPRTLTDPKTWGANVELTGTSDGVPTYLRIQAAKIAMDFATGEVNVPRGSAIEVTERHGESERTFRMDADGKRYAGDFGAMEKHAWLARILHRQTDLPDNVIETLTR